MNFPGWSGHLPAPAIPKAIGRFLFDRIRDLNTIESYLENAYANRGAFGEKLVSVLWNMLGCAVVIGIQSQLWCLMAQIVTHIVYCLWFLFFWENR